MPQYAVLLLPSANRVYAQAAVSLLRDEIVAIDRLLLGGVVIGAEPATIGGVDYLVLDCAHELDAHAVRLLSNVSSLYALFRRRDDVLVPVEVQGRAVHDDDLLTIQRYPGKTNEQFTKLLLNVTVAASAGAARRACEGTRLRVLDPLCGRGTTLNHALFYGFHAAGIELDRRDADAYESFLRTWLKDKRLGHKAEASTLRRGRAAAAHRVHVTVHLRPAREGDPKPEVQHVDIVNDDTVNALGHFAKSSFDALVADLPYGVQHGARAAQATSRRPEALLADALPVWRSVLRGGGAMGLAFNVRTLPRDLLVALVTEAGFVLATDGELPTFEHRVDRAITRQALFAVKR